MTAVLALGETPETARYVTHDPAAVEAFRVRYPFLVPLLTEALGSLGDPFGTDTPLVVAGSPRPRRRPPGSHSTPSRSATSNSLPRSSMWNPPSAPGPSASVTS